jgi:hypothetical protein
MSSDCEIYRQAAIRANNWINKSNARVSGAKRKDRIMSDENIEGSTSTLRPVDAAGSVLLDKTGREIHVGDTLKVFHFTARLRRKKHYMYKYVKERITATNGEERFIILHLCGDLEGYYVESINGRKLEDVEIVQGFGGVRRNCCFSDRPILKPNAGIERPMVPQKGRGN